MLAEQDGDTGITVGIREEGLLLKGEVTLSFASLKFRARQVVGGVVAYIKAEQGRGGADLEEILPAGWSKKVKSLGNGLNQCFKELILDLTHSQQNLVKKMIRPL
ncbi:MAG: hypothetical protein LBV77_07215 [Candidatus Adiutrix intracellularis]|nr:hypothetical protein [Candidatus Adiutrix intracellularis]